MGIIPLKQIFPKAHFKPPATETKIAAAEALIGVRLPEQLRAFYFECDGFREDRGNAKYLLSLTDKDFIGSLVDTRDTWAEFPFLKPFLFFGSSGADENWGINWQGTGEVIAYHPHMEGHYETLGSDIVEIWRADYARYDSVTGT